MCEISIIVPVFNVEKYLNRCIDSILSQSFGDYELLLVDDGSADGSGKICDEYAKKDSRIKVFHKNNGGLSSARNFGIEQSSAPYIGFVDSDDYIAPDMYELLYYNIQKEDADISMCALFDIYNGRPEKVNKKTEYFVTDSAEAVRIVMEAQKTSVTAVNKLYKRKLFDNIRYPEGRIAEDAFVIVDILLLVKKAVITTEQKYYYVHRKESITTSGFKKKDCDVIEAYEKNHALIKEHYPELEDTAKMRVCWAYFYVLDKMMLADGRKENELLDKIVRYLRGNFKFIMKDTRFNKTRKTAMTALMINKKLYKLCVRARAKRLKI